jgi:hypothetical protein
MLNVAAVQAEIEYRQQQLASEAEEYRRAKLAVGTRQRSERGGLRGRLHWPAGRRAQGSSVRAA